MIRFFFPWALCLLQPLFASSIHPEVLLGWQVTVRSKVTLTRISTEGAPRLPSWEAHGNRQEISWPVVDQQSGTLLERKLKTLLKEVLHKSNKYLSEEYRGNFKIWVFKNVPYTAKTLEDAIIVSAAPVLQPLEHKARKQLSCILAHELHHVAVGPQFFQIDPLRPRQILLTSLLTEGAASRICVGDHSFPEFETVLKNEKALSAAFQDVRNILRQPPDHEGMAQLYTRSKSGYYVGCWMIMQIENRFGRSAWLSLLDEAPELATIKFFDLYAKTNPPALYQLSLQ
ncbi:MAG: hypothetical protein HY645_13255 [Acidobacteria bacterium]|nr:hypothetical protein [Acidobacteriota bacterium]